MPIKLILIRGLPGSGKSTRARALLNNMDAVHIEADMYFEDALGNYNYQPEKIADAHRWCKQRTRNALKQGRTVIVANTFVERWEVEPYLKMAEQCNARIEILTCRDEYQNIHGVPQETIERMRDKWQENVN